MNFKKIIIIIFFCLGSVFIFIFNFNINTKYPSLIILSPNITDPLEKIMAQSFGVRKLYSDILYIRFLHYYGTREDGNWEFGDGIYPMLYPYSKDIVINDPYYTNAVIVCASSLAFGVKRINNAISILRFAISYDRNNIKYITLLSAILTFAIRQNIYDEKLLDELYSFAKMSNVPDMIRNVVAFLCKKTFQYERALEIYNLIIKESRDDFYIERAKNQVKYINRLKGVIVDENS